MRNESSSSKQTTTVHPFDYPAELAVVTQNTRCRCFFAFSLLSTTTVHHHRSSNCIAPQPLLLSCICFIVYYCNKETTNKEKKKQKVIMAEEIRWVYCWKEERILLFCEEADGAGWTMINDDDDDVQCCSHRCRSPSTLPHGWIHRLCYTNGVPVSKLLILASIPKFNANFSSLFPSSQY